LIVENNRGVAILSAIPKRFELLVYRTMYEDLKNLISVNQHGFLEYASFVLNSRWMAGGFRLHGLFECF
jgi:hypothetical protein